jgi:tetratricopeptide (TPR) repeat protein
MRAAIMLAAGSVLVFGVTSVEAQIQRSREYIPRPGGGVAVREQITRFPQPQPAAPARVNPHDWARGGVGGTGSPYGFAYQPFPWGYGWNWGYGIESFTGIGGLGVYQGPAYWGPLIHPPTFAYPPMGFGATFGYATAWPGVWPDPLNNTLLQQQYNDEWTRLSAQLADLEARNVSDPLPGRGGAVPIPSTPEAQLRSLRAQAQGDEAFARQDYHRAWDRYRSAASTAKDNGAAYMRVGYALVALGRLSSAVQYFKRGLSLDPAMAAIGPTPDDLYRDNRLAWNAHLARVTQWVQEDIRDAERVFLLGLLLHYDNDPRSREFLERAWQLSGGTETAVVTLLNPPHIEDVRELEPSTDENTQNGEAEEALGSEAGPIVPADPIPQERGLPGDRETPADDALEVPQPPPVEEETVPPRPPGRPAWQEPLFPLPSQQHQREPEDEALPPLPQE